MAPKKLKPRNAPGGTSKPKQIQVTPNKEWNSLEISFSEKPSRAIREKLSKHGFTWAPVKKRWYKTNATAANEKLIETLKAK